GGTPKESAAIVYSVRGPDTITILAAQPADGAAIAAGFAPPIFAFVDYELTSMDRAEIFLELTFENSKQVIATSNTLRVVKGKGKFRETGQYLVLDSFLFPDTSSRLLLTAWLADTQGRSRLVASSPVAYTSKPAPKFTLEISL